MAEYSYAPGYSQRKEGVQLFQGKLNDIRSSYHGGWDSLAVDGSYGKDTENAVREFQKSAGLSPTGVLDNRTMESLNTFCRDRELASRRSAYPSYSAVHSQYSPTMGYRYDPRGNVQYRYEVHCPILEEVIIPGFQWYYSCTEDWWNGIAADFETFIEKIAKYKFKEWGAAISQFLNLIKTKIEGMVKVLKTKITLPKISFDKAKLVLQGLKSQGAKIATSVSNSLKTGGKICSEFFTKTNMWKVARGNIFGIIMALAPFAWNVIMSIFAKDPKPYRDDLWKSFQGAIGALSVIILTELATVIVVTAAGASAMAGVIACVIAILVAIADLLVLYFSGQGLGDWLVYLSKELACLQIQLGKAAWNTSVNAAKTGIKYAKAGVKTFKEEVSEAFDDFNMAVSNFSVYVDDAVTQAVDGVSNAFNSLGNAFDDLLPDWLDF